MTTTDDGDRGRSDVAGNVAQAIASWRARGVAEDAAAFARGVVLSAAPRGPARARTLLWACSRLGAWAMTVGLELSPQVCLHPSVIERFCVFARSGAPPSQRRCLRSDLRFVALRAVPEVAQGPLPAPLARDRAKGPYTQAEIEGYFALAAAQATEERCQHLVALLCLGLGAGLSGSDLRYVRGNHVMERSGGVVVVVEGPRARVVPVLRRYHEALLAAAAFAEERFICGGESPWRRNVTAPLTKRLHGGADLARLEVGRLRSTWLAHQLEALGLRALFQGAGISCSQRLGDLATRLAPLSEEDLVEALGGRIV